MNLKNIVAMICICISSIGCTSDQNNAPEMVQNPQQLNFKEFQRSSSIADIEKRVVHDLKLIGKTDQEIGDYLVEWKKQNSHLIK